MAASGRDRRTCVRYQGARRTALGAGLPSCFIGHHPDTGWTRAGPTFGTSWRVRTSVADVGGRPEPAHGRSTCSCRSSCCRRCRWRAIPIVGLRRERRLAPARALDLAAHRPASRGPRRSPSCSIGNTNMWVAAMIAAGDASSAWPSVIDPEFKPAFAPFALIGDQPTSWWVAMGDPCASRHLPFGAMWLRLRDGDPRTRRCRSDGRG